MLRTSSGCSLMCRATLLKIPLTASGLSRAPTRSGMVRNFHSFVIRLGGNPVPISRRNTALCGHAPAPTIPLGSALSQEPDTESVPPRLDRSLNHGHGSQVPVDRRGLLARLPAGVHECGDRRWLCGHHCQAFLYAELLIHAPVALPGLSGILRINARRVLPPVSDRNCGGRFGLQASNPWGGQDECLFSVIHVHTILHASGR